MSTRSLSSSSLRPESTGALGSVFLITSDGRVLDLPIPSNSPRDPLNWSTWKRLRAGLAIVFFSIIGLVLVQGPSLMFVDLVAAFPPEDTSPFDISILLSAPTLFMGIGAFIWIPLSFAVGRRPVFLLNVVIMLVATVWAAEAVYFVEILLAVCLQGMATGLNMSGMLVMIIDLTFIHERPQFIAIFWSVGSFICLAILASIPHLVEASGSWRLFYSYSAIPSVIALIMTFFWYEETYFVRPPVAFDGRVLVQTATEKVKIYEEWIEVPGGKVLPDTPDDTSWKLLSRKFGFWRIMPGGWRKMLVCYPQILLCICNPLILCVALLNAVVFGSMLSIGMTYVSVLSSPPYNLPLDIIALVNLAGAFGALLAWPATGILTSKVCQKLAIRNGGFQDAEHYLPAYILPILAGIASIVLYGCTVELNLHFLLVYVAYFLNAFTSISLGIANTLWVTASFPRWAASALVVVGGGSYVVSFGISFAILPWVKSQGYLKENLEIGILILVGGSLLIPVAFWGKSLRHYIDRRWARYEVGALRPQ